ncbi:MAG TPA: preprotein translocase subunit SecE [Terracidiphilus sp.]|jgi:preprotein translocase subunit SecE|nr:preprotein translocase subunit SecE [Terracidiphilus sp.]
MASKAVMASGDDQSIKKKQGPGPFDGVVAKWNDFTRFLTDVRAEMRKVVAPSRKEVQVTTSVVIVAVFLFGVFFFLVDWVFRVGVNALLNHLGGM